MKLDWEEIEKGITEELQKTASLEKEAYVGAAAAALARLLGPLARGAARHVAAPVVGGVINNVGVPVAKTIAKHPFISAAAGATATPYLAEQYAPEWHQKALENSGIYSGANDVQRGIRGVAEGVGLAKDTVSGAAGLASEGAGALADLSGASTTPAKPGDGVVENLARAREGARGFFDASKGALKDFRGFLTDTKSKMSDLFNSANTGLSSALSGMGDYGKYLPLGLGILGGGLGGYLLSRKKKNDLTGTPQSVVNINLGGRRGGLLDYDPSGVGSLSSIKMGSITDALASAAGRRMADKVLNNAVGVPAQEPVRHTDPRAIELTSKHPEIAEMLKNEQTKAYLEKLLEE